MDELNIEDVKRYAAQNTDFGFEMQVLQIFKTFGCEVEHSGTYVDPVSKKNREFDLRVKIKRKNRAHITWLSVECKNLSPSFPLIVQSVQRSNQDAFHEIIHYVHNNRQPQVRRRIKHGRYACGQLDWVGKSFDQIRFDKKKDDFISNEGKTFDKMSQALSSAHGLLERCLPDLSLNNNAKYVVIPILVVPDRCIWRVSYDENGETIGAPQQVKSIQYFVNQEWQFQLNGFNAKYSMSHLEILTYSAVREFTQELMDEESVMGDATFALD